MDFDPFPDAKDRDRFPNYDGVTFDPTEDKARLKKMHDRLYAHVKDGVWRERQEIVAFIGHGHDWATIGARMRDFRKPQFQAVYPNHGMESDRVKGGRYRYFLCTCAVQPCWHTPWIERGVARRKKKKKP